MTQQRQTIFSIYGLPNALRQLQNKINTLEANGAGSGGTSANLSVSSTSQYIDILNSGGTSARLPAATELASGLMSAIDKSKLDTLASTLESDLLEKKSVLDYVTGAETVSANGNAILDRAFADTVYHNIYIPKGVTITCTQSLTIPANKTLSGPGTVVFSTGNLRLSSNVSVLSLNVRGIAKNNGGSGISFLANSTDSKVINCDIRDVQHSGININGGCHNAIIFGNTIDNCGGRDGAGPSDTSYNITYQGMGIYASGQTTPINNLLISENKISNIYGQGGVFLQSVTGLVIEKNIINDTYNRGICLTGTNTGCILDNRISECGSINNTTNGVGCNGIFINLTVTSNDVFVIGNIIDKVGENGIEGRLTAIGNIVSNTGYYPALVTPSKEGIYLSAESKAIGNFIVNTAMHGIYSYSSTSKSNLAITGNTIINPTQMGIFVVADGCTLTSGLVSKNTIFGENDPTKSGVGITVANGGVLTNFRCGDNEVFGRSNSIHSTVVGTGPTIALSATYNETGVVVTPNPGTGFTFAGATKKKSGIMTTLDKRSLDNSKEISEALLELTTDVPTIATTTVEPSGLRRIAPIDPIMFVSGTALTWDNATARYPFYGAGSRFIEFKSDGTTYSFGFVASGTERFKILVDDKVISDASFTSTIATTNGTGYWMTLTFPTNKIRKIKIVFVGISAIVAMDVGVNSNQYAIPKPTNKIGVIGSSAIGTTDQLDSSIVNMLLLANANYVIETETGSGYKALGSGGFNYAGSNKVTRMSAFQPDTLILFDSDDTDAANVNFVNDVATILNAYIAALPNANIICIGPVARSTTDTYTANRLALAIALKTKCEEKGVTFYDATGIMGNNGVLPNSWSSSATYNAGDYVYWYGAIWKSLCTGITGTFREPYKFSQWTIQGILPLTGVGSVAAPANDGGTRDTYLASAGNYQTAVGAKMLGLKLAYQLRASKLV
jgi:hypothetical protein